MSAHHEPPESSRELRTLERYRNWQGIVADRTARFEALLYSSTEWHRTPQWLIKAIDLDKGEVRLFALQDIVPVDSD
jgi:hypothetical protein